MTVKIMEVCKVVPPPDSPTEMSLPLTFFDLFVAESKPAEHLLFYKLDPLFSNSVLVSKLKYSLSLTLKHFLPFCGNLVLPPSSPKPILVYEKGNGIIFTIAQSSDDFHHLSSKNMRESQTLYPLIARIVGSDYKSPLFAVKVTIFPKKGFCIGVTDQATAGDGKTMSMFFKMWASFSKFGKTTEPIPDFNRKSIIDTYAELKSSSIEFLLKKNGQSYFQLDRWESVPPSSETLHGTFLIRDLQIRKLKELITTRLASFVYNGQDNRSPYISTYTVTYAFVVLCMVKAKTIANNKVNVLVHYNCRGRLKPPISENYIGNCIGVCFMYFDKNKLLGEDGLMMIANSINMSINRVKNDGALIGAKEWLPNRIKVATDDESMEVYVASSSRFGYHNVDFGWGRPIKADIFEKSGITFIEVGDGFGGKGIEVDLCLSKGEMEKFVSIFDLELNKMMQHTVLAGL